MNDAIRAYSAVLKLNTARLDALIHSDEGRAWALKMIIVVGLIAGLGHWFGLPAALQQKSLAQQIDKIGAVAVNGAGAVTGAAARLLTSGDPQAAVSAAGAALRERIVSMTDPLRAAVSSAAGNVPTVDELLARDSVTAEQIAAVAQRADVTADTIGRLAQRADLTPEQLDQLLAAARVTPEQAGEIRALVENSLGAVSVELQPLLDGLKMTPAEFKRLLAPVGLTAQQVARALKGLSVTPAELGALAARISATPGELQGLIDRLSAIAATTEPALGVPASGALQILGRWLATPLQLLASWALFALVLLVVARLIGGHGTLPEHIAAVALAGAPLVLTLGLYIPDISALTSIPFDFALRLVGRFFALIGLAWAALLLIRTLSLAHGFTPWRSVAAILLTWLAVVAVVPVASALLAGYLVI